MSDDPRVEVAADAIKNMPVRDPNEPNGELDRLRRHEAARAMIAALDDARDAEIKRLRKMLMQVHTDCNEQRMEWEDCGVSKDDAETLVRQLVDYTAPDNVDRTALQGGDDGS